MFFEWLNYVDEVGGACGAYGRGDQCIWKGRPVHMEGETSAYGRGDQCMWKGDQCIWKGRPVHVIFWCENRKQRNTLVDFQLDAQNSYLFIYNTFIKILYMFRALPCSSSGGLRRNCIYAASGIVTVCRWRWRYHRLHIYHYDVDLLKMSRVMLETCRGF